MLEWYRANACYEALMEDCAAILALAADAAEVPEFRHGETTCDPRDRPMRTVVAAEFMRHGVDLLSTLPKGAPDTPALARALAEAGIATAPDDSWSDLFSRMLTERVEPGLGPGPVILDAYPAPEAALARRQPDDPRLAERFELFACGVELANAFGELYRSSRTARALRSPTWTCARRFTATACRWTRISLPRWTTCRPPRVARWASTGW